MNRHDDLPPEGTTHYKLFPFGKDYFFKVERSFTGDTWYLFGSTWQEYNLDRQDPDIWPIHSRKTHEADLRQALEALMLFSKPTKTNAMALHNAHQVLIEIDRQKAGLRPGLTATGRFPSQPEIQEFPKQES